MSRRKRKTRPDKPKPLGLSDLPPHWRERVENELEQGEDIVWLGLPDPKLYSLRSWRFVLPCAIIGLLGVFMLAAIVPATYALATFVIGLAMLCVIPLLTYYSAGSLCYLLTEQRAIIFSGSLIKTVDSIPSVNLTNTEVRPALGKNDGGDLILKRVTVRDSVLDSSGNHDQRLSSREYAFYAIPHVKSVKRIVTDVAQRAWKKSK